MRKLWLPCRPLVYDQDQQLLSGILSSMIEDILQDVVAAKSSREV
jgi:hypothetical protein